MILLTAEDVDHPCQGEPTSCQGDATVEVKANPQSPSTAVTKITHRAEPVDVTNNHYYQTNNN